MIPEEARTGRVLDVGFGTFPLFLSGTRFAERYGIDRNVPPELENLPHMHLVAHDVEHKRTLPFESGFFDAATMLAVLEHLDDEVLIALLNEIHRVLVIGGVFVLTTPADWTAGILKVMSRLRLVSAEEVEEHRAQYSPRAIRDLLARGGFNLDAVEVGSFELGMNLWARARRTT